MNRRALILVGAGLVSALAAAIVLYVLYNAIRSGAAEATTAAQIVPTRFVPAGSRSVVVATTDIAANSPIDTSMLTLASYPVDLVPTDVFTDVNSVISSIPTVPIFGGTILLQRQFVAANGRTGASVTIPPGKVLAAFPSTDMLNATGAVQPGDRVDILLSMPISGTARLDASAPAGSQVEGLRTLVSQGTLQNVEVYSVGFWTPPGQQPAPQGQAAEGNQLKIITFLVDHQEAIILKYLKDSGGLIDLVVRSAQDNNVVETDPVTVDYLVDLFGFIGLTPPRQPEAPPIVPEETPVPAPQP